MTTNSNIVGVATSANALPAGQHSELATANNVGVSSRILGTREEEPENSDTEDGQYALIPEITFVPTQCLFCNTLSSTFDANLSHMHKKHGLFLPASIDDGRHVLAVDMATLVQYLHLVIVGYHECLFCHTQRQNPHAVQQHMMGRGHCRVKLEDDDVEGNEYRDFYADADGLGSEEEDGDGDSFGDAEGDGLMLRTSTAPRTTALSQLGDNTLRLSSGKVLAHRSTPPPTRTNRRTLAELQAHGRRGRGAVDLLPDNMIADRDSGPGSPSYSPDPLPAPTTTATATATAAAATSPAVAAETQVALTRPERRALTHHKSALTTALAQMSVRDRSALSHLPAAEQRSMIVRQFKQRDRTRLAERKYGSKLETYSS